MAKARKLTVSKPDVELILSHEEAGALLHIMAATSWEGSDPIYDALAAAGVDYQEDLWDVVGTLAIERLDG